MLPLSGRWVALIVAGLGLSVTPARAEQVRFLYIPIDEAGNTKQVPNGPGGAWGERVVGFGLVPEPFHQQFTPTHLVTFRHPANSRGVTVPMTLPSATPRLEYLSDRIVYNYGSYVVEARFRQDGSVEVVYNSGFLRPLQVR